MITVEHLINSGKSTEQTNQAFKRSLRGQIISGLTHLVKVMEIKHIDGWEGIPFSNVDALVNQVDISTEHLFVLQNLLENKLEHSLYDIYQEEYYLKHNASDFIITK